MKLYYRIFRLIRKTTTVLLILGFFVNIFSNLPFNKIKAMINPDTEEIVLNEEYIEDNVTTLYEVESLRTETTKTFMNSDGSLSRYNYKELIHELIDDEYQEIDSTFKDIESEYESKQLEYKVNIPKKIHENKKIKLQYQNSKLEITYNNINKTEGKNIENSPNNITDLTRLMGSLYYENVYKNVDLEIQSTSTLFKENIIIMSRLRSTLTFFLSRSFFFFFLTVFFLSLFLF